MKYGDEYYVEVPSGLDLDLVPRKNLRSLLQNANLISRFHSSPNSSFIHDHKNPLLRNFLSYKIDEDCLIEINDSFHRTPTIVHNKVSDLISFQFVSSVKRSEYLGGHKNVHNLGPAIIVTAVRGDETTYRMPKMNQNIRHVMIHTTLSNLMARLGESLDNYPSWLREILEGNIEKPRQRVLFLESVHRDLIWTCFHLPVSGVLLGHWMAAKFIELLCTGLQILKNNQVLIKQPSIDQTIPDEENIRRARTILNREYANPPSLTSLAKGLGLSETRLKSGFKIMNGTTILQYCINRRIDAAKLLLNENKHSISEIGDIVGYQDHSAFTRAFRGHTGYSPREWLETENPQ